MKDRNKSGHVVVERSERPVGSDGEAIEHVDAISLSLEDGLSNGLPSCLDFNDSPLSEIGVDNLRKNQYKCQTLKTE